MLDFRLFNDLLKLQKFLLEFSQQRRVFVDQQKIGFDLLNGFLKVIDDMQLRADGFFFFEQTGRFLGIVPN